MSLYGGLYDLEIQEEILGNENQDLDLESTIKIIEAKEASRRSQESFIAEGTHAVNQHKKSKNDVVSIDRTAVCEKCVSSSHARPRGYGGKVRPHKMCKQCFKLQKNLLSKSTTGSASEESGNIIDVIFSCCSHVHQSYETETYSAVT